MQSTSLCPCQSGSDFTKCCEPYLIKAKKPETAEQLMRARYTAFTKVNMDFIENTHDPKTRKTIDMDDNRDWAENTKWLGLEILNTKDGGSDDQKGMVEFIAKFDSGDGEVKHHELSEFTKHNGQWFFTDSTNPSAKTYVRTEAKIGRNDPCLCGSGKKYKKCCGNN